MNYEQLISTITSILNDDTIHKQGFSLVYELNPKRHKQMNEHLFYKSNPPNETPIYSDEFEAEVGGITIKFIKKINNFD